MSHQSRLYLQKSRTLAHNPRAKPHAKCPARSVTTGADRQCESQFSWRTRGEDSKGEWKSMMVEVQNIMRITYMLHPLKHYPASCKAVDIIERVSNVIVQNTNS